jgi:hypothetical protein
MARRNFTRVYAPFRLKPGRKRKSASSCSLLKLCDLHIEKTPEVASTGQPVGKFRTSFRGHEANFHPSEMIVKTALKKPAQKPAARSIKRTAMNANRLRTGFIVVALLAINGGLSGLGYHGWYSTESALAASAQEKAQARTSLNQVTAALRSVDTAYASGNAAEAQTKFEEAKSDWDKVAPAISAREAREAQLLFDSLGKKLKDGAPPAQIKSTVSGMLEEFREDIGRELR